MPIASTDTKASIDDQGGSLPIKDPRYDHALGQVGVDTNANVAPDGRIDLNIRQTSHRLAALLSKAVHLGINAQNKDSDKTERRQSHQDGAHQDPPPRLNIVMHVVGSRGDVQPFIALGRKLKHKYGHRVRLATHLSFKKVVTDADLEFFNIGGDPAELMSYMVKNPGVLPELSTLTSGEVSKRRKDIADIIDGCWRSCVQSDDGMSSRSAPATEHLAQVTSSHEPEPDQPFVADVILANPPSFAHIHCAEKLGCPLVICFTMPYSPTTAFPHPLANIKSTNADVSVTNFLSYLLVDTLTTQGLGDIINRFRQSLGLEPISLMWSPGTIARLRVPHIYCWSPALIPKPADWADHIAIPGFFFLDSEEKFEPPSDLARFLDQGDPPVYIGFGSIVVDDPTAMTKMILDAVRKTGGRALISKGWGGLGADQFDIPDGVFMIDSVPHDWLFQHVSAVVHHGGAGTTSAGIRAGKPTVIVPFFGDQPFWGAMVAKAGAGPEPIPYKALDADKLADQIAFALKPETLKAARELSDSIGQERGVETGAHDFHELLALDKLRCTLDPSRAAVWRLRRTNVRLSALAATVLINEQLLSYHDLKLNRPIEYETETGPYDPVITGGAGAILSTITTILGGVTDVPIEAIKGLMSHPSDTSTTATASQDQDQSDVTTSSKQDKAQSTSNTPPDSDAEPRSHRRSISAALRSRTRQDSASRSPKLTSMDTAIDTTVDTSKNIARIVEAGIKAPMDFTHSVARGFHNAPKLYGDETVRPSEPITNFKTGVMAAGKEFGFGMYDGITGLITQPVQGARRDGAMGFIKGVGKGIGGVMLKPGAAVFGVPGFTMKGLYKQIQSALDSTPLSQILAARTVQGYSDYQAANDSERLDIVSRWKTLEPTLVRKRNPDEVIVKWHHTQKQKIMDLIKQRTRKSGTNITPSIADDVKTDPRTPSQDGLVKTSDGTTFSDEELRKAIKQSVESDTSNADADRDDLERAMRASVLALEKRPKFRAGGNASLDEQDFEIQKALSSGVANAYLFPGGPAEGEDLELVRAVTATLAELDKF